MTLKLVLDYIHKETFNRFTHLTLRYIGTGPQDLFRNIFGNEKVS